MKKGRIILGAAATLVTVVSAFAFKATRTNHKQLFGTAGTSACFQVNCWTLSSGNGGACLSLAGNVTANNVYLTKTVGTHCKTAPSTYTSTAQ